MATKSLADDWTTSGEHEDVPLLAPNEDDRPSRTHRPRKRRKTSLAIATALTLTGGAVIAYFSSSGAPFRVDTAPWSAVEVVDEASTFVPPLRSAARVDTGEVWTSSPSWRAGTPSSSASEVRPSSSTLPSPIASAAPSHPPPPDGQLDTRPPSPALLPAPSHERFLAYLPHSGLHNQVHSLQNAKRKLTRRQRIELQNALLLAHLTNRTLLIPLARLGHPLPWKATPLLQNLWHDQQKSALTRCRKLLSQLESGKDVHDYGCRKYAEYAQVSWEFLVDLERLPVPVRLVDRLDLDRDWLTSDQGLNISTDSIRSFDDPDRYSWRLYDDSTDQTKLVNYKNRLNIDDLNAEDYARYDLLEFGSMFGSSRWILSKATSRAMLQSITLSLTFQMPVLDVVADEIEESLGGRANYIGLHLRVGDGGFKRVAVKGMQNVFRQLCSRVLALDDKTTERLVAEASALPMRRSHSTARSPAWTFLDEHEPSSLHARQELPISRRHMAKRQATTAKITCRGPLHTDPALSALNTRVYIATDAHSPLDEPSLAPFRHALPCLSFLSDFRDLVPELPALDPLRSEQEGVKMAPFLLPMLEAMIAGRGRVVLGTKGSTFSRYVVSVLHESYWREETNG